MLHVFRSKSRVFLGFLHFSSPMADNLQHLSLSDEEDQALEVVPLVDTSSFSYDLCFVGMFLTYSRINFNSMRDVLAELWHPLGGVSITDLGAKRFLFRFYTPVDFERVWNGTPWLFNNHLLILHPLQHGEVPLLVPLIYVSEWVQIHDLKAGFFSESVARSLANFIGDYLDHDLTRVSTVESESYVRVRVRMDVRNPLKRRHRLVAPDGTSFFARFAYEHFQVFCFPCGRLGHTDSFCDLLLHHKKESLTPHWGPELKAIQRRYQRPTSSWLRFENLSLHSQAPASGGNSSFQNQLPSQVFLNSFLGALATDGENDFSAGSMETDCNGDKQDAGENDPLYKPDDGKKRQRVVSTGIVSDTMDSRSGSSSLSAEPAERVARQQ